jgi:hypothetical protein
MKISFSRTAYCLFLIIGLLSFFSHAEDLPSLPEESNITEETSPNVSPDANPNAPLETPLIQEQTPVKEVIPTTSAAPVEEPQIYNEADFTDTVVLQLLNKVTARVSSLEIAQGHTGNFGNLEISLQRCWKSPPEQDPENKALLRISEKVPGEDIKEIFNGWMFSSSPSLSALEHPVYDVTVVACKNKEVKKEEAPATTPAPEEKKEGEVKKEEKPKEKKKAAPKKEVKE